MSEYERDHKVTVLAFGKKRDAVYLEPLEGTPYHVVRAAGSPVAVHFWDLYPYEGPVAKIVGEYVEVLEPNISDWAALEDALREHFRKEFENE